MLELKYSYIGDLQPKLQPVVAEFGRKNHLQVELLRLGWEDAWHQLLQWSLHGPYGQGPDISHIGATWGGSLVGMESLRPFTPQEIRAMGGKETFLPHCWQSGVNVDKEKAWSLPWQSYTYLLAYRRDLLEKFAIDEKTAFQTSHSLNETVARLKGNINESPWVVPIANDHLDTLHYVSSWVWGSGGDFFTSDNLQVAFLEPTTLDAICSYYTLLHSMTLAAYPSNKLAAQNIFMDGNAAVSIIGADNAYHWFLDQQAMSPEMRQKIGFAPIPGTPWVGGDTIIIWKQACISPDRERAAVALAQHLVSAETQRSFAQGEFINLPTRADAFDALPMQNTSLTNSVIYSLRVGRSHRPMSMWAKIEYQFANVFGRTGAEILAGADVATTVRKNLEAHAKWLEIVLQR